MSSDWSLSADASIPNVFLGADQPLYQELWRVWRSRSARNAERSVYYDGEAALKDFGISLPPQMRSISAALGWSAKGVHGVTNRSNFEGFVDPSGADDPFGLAQILDENQFDQEFQAARVSSAVHGCSFLTVTRGDVASGEPEILVLASGADQSAAIWDRRTRSLRAFLTVGSSDELGRPEWATVYTKNAVHNLSRSADKWSVDSRPNPVGRVTVAPLVYGYELRRPLGHSRITRASMGFVDSALRTIVRAEVSSEFYSAPEYFLFGADVSGFAGDDKWSAIMGRIKAWDYDAESGEPAPTLQRFSGASPQPHTDQLRMWANLFADDQDLEVKFADASNPSSADAIFAAKETLITTTRDANRSWARGAVQAMRFADMLRAGSSDLSGLRAQFTDPAIVSPSARANAYTQISSVDPDFATSRVGRSYAGLTQTQIMELEAEAQRRQSSDRLSLLAEAARGLRNGDSGSGAGVQAGESGSNAVGTVAAAGLPE